MSDGSWRDWDWKHVVCALAAWPVAARADPPRVLLSNLASSPTSAVPGDPGWVFNTGIIADDVFLRFVAAPSGARWAVGAVAKSGAVTQQVIVAGSGATTTGAVRVARSGLATFFDAGRTYEILRPAIGLNDAGELAFGGNASGASGDDEFVARWSAPSAFVLYAREGQAAPGLPAGIGFGAFDDGVHICGAGVRFRSALLTGSTSKQAVFSLPNAGAGSALFETDVTVPPGQLVLPAESVDSFPADRLASDASGQRMLCIVDLNGSTSTDLVAVLDGTVVAQEGAALPATGVAMAISGFTTDTSAQRFSPDGSHWLLRGAWSNLDEWVLLDGVIYARTGDATVSGGVEVYDDAVELETFAAADVNDAGNVVVAGAITSASTFANEVAVMDRQFVAFREGDGVDVNGDGEANDDAFIAGVGKGGLALTNERRLFAVVSLRNSAASMIGSAVITLRVGCSDIDFNNDEVYPDFTDLLDFLDVFAAGPCSTGMCDSIDFNNDSLYPDTADLEAYLRVFGGGAC